MSHDKQTTGQCSIKAKDLWESFGQVSEEKQQRWTAETEEQSA